MLIVGFSRVFFGLKGWEFYIFNWAFWAKMAAFAAVGLLSIIPTSAFMRWHQAARDDPTFAVAGSGDRAVCARFCAPKASVFVLIPIFAAVMARGIGY